MSDIDSLKNDPDTTAKAFQAELKALLEKYDAQIGFSCGEGSDTHGLYDEQIYFSFKLPKTPTAAYAVWSEPYKLADGYGIDKTDI